jgi:putative addiction module CopG family antidote
MQVESVLGGRLLIGALVRNTDLAYHPLVEQRYPVLASAIIAGASQQLRNKASTGGNGCSAIGGLNRMHAILGASGACIAVHPSEYLRGARDIGRESPRQRLSGRPHRGVRRLPSTARRNAPTRHQVSTGRYGSSSEVVREALRLMEKTEEQEAEKLALLRQAWKEGIDSDDAGEIDFMALKREARAAWPRQSVTVTRVQFTAGS